MRSYFITKNMEEDFGRKTKINGILPILLWSAAKTNQTAAQSALEVKLAELNAPLLKESVRVNGITKSYQDFIAMQQNRIVDISRNNYKYQKGIIDRAEEN